MTPPPLPSSPLPRPLSCPQVDLCHIALGAVDGYWEFNLKPWDQAAGALVVMEAGGKLTTMTGEAFDVFDKSIVAAHPSMHAAILAKVKPPTDKLVRGGYDLKRMPRPVGYGF